MKKLALSLVLGASLAIAPSVFALTSMTDANMKSATGQAGVSITLDNVVIEQFIGSTTYTDDDGTDGTAGSIVISDKHTIKGYNALTGEAMFTAKHYTADWNKAAALSIDVGKCSILMAGNNGNMVALRDSTDAADVTAVTTMNNMITAGYTKDQFANALYSTGAADSYAQARGLFEFASNSWTDLDVVGVVIGLPTLEITTSADTYSVGVQMTDAINDGDNFITISKSDSRMAIISGVVEIAAH